MPVGLRVSARCLPTVRCRPGSRKRISTSCPQLRQPGSELHRVPMGASGACVVLLLRRLPVRGRTVDAKRSVEPLHAAGWRRFPRSPQRVPRRAAAVRAKRTSGVRRRPDLGRRQRRSRSWELAWFPFDPLRRVRFGRASVARERDAYGSPDGAAAAAASVTGAASLRIAVDPPKHWGTLWVSWLPPRSDFGSYSFSASVESRAPSFEFGQHALHPAGGERCRRGARHWPSKVRKVPSWLVHHPAPNPPEACSHRRSC